MKFSGVLRIVS